jgi:hypothetical protein
LPRWTKDKINGNASYACVVPLSLSLSPKTVVMLITFPFSLVDQTPTKARNMFFPQPQFLLHRTRVPSFAVLAYPIPDNGRNHAVHHHLFPAATEFIMVMCRNGSRNKNNHIRFEPLGILCYKRKPQTKLRIILAMHAIPVSTSPPLQCKYYFHRPRATF